MTRFDLRATDLRALNSLTKYPSIRGVRFSSSDRPEPGPVLRRRSFRDLMPPIVVDEPRGGDTVHSPLIVTGTADVFEATVTLRLLDAAGKEIARTFTTATCGTGCRGDFSTQIDVPIDAEQPGTVQVFEYSAKDGSMINVVEIPVVLAPRAP